MDLLRSLSSGRARQGGGWTRMEEGDRITCSSCCFLSGLADHFTSQQLKFSMVHLADSLPVRQWHANSCTGTTRRGLERASLPAHCGTLSTRGHLFNRKILLVRCGWRSWMHHGTISRWVRPWPAAVAKPRRNVSSGPDQRRRRCHLRRHWMGQTGRAQQETANAGACMVAHSVGDAAACMDRSCKMACIATGHEGGEGGERKTWNVTCPRDGRKRWQGDTDVREGGRATSYGNENGWWRLHCGTLTWMVFNIIWCPNVYGILNIQTFITDINYWYL